MALIRQIDSLPVSRGNVLSFLWVVGSVLMTATAGGRCVDVAICTFSHPANLRRLSHVLVRLLGQRFQTHIVENTHPEVNIKIHTHYLTTAAPFWWIVVHVRDHIRHFFPISYGYDVMTLLFFCLLECLQIQTQHQTAVFYLQVPHIQK